MEEEYIPQSQQPVDQTEAYGDRGGPQAVPTSNEQFLEAMNYEANREPKLPEKEHRELAKWLKELQGKYKTGTKEDQAMITAEMTKRKDKMFKSEEFRKLLANDLSDTNSFGHNPTEKLAEHMPDIMDIVNGKKEATYDDSDVPGYELVDGWKSMEQIHEMINSRKVDQASKASIKALIEDSMRTAETIQSGEDSTFNYQKEHNNIMQKVVNQGDIRSLATDKMFGERVFRDDLQSAIKLGTYKDMGVPEDQIKDPTPGDGKITDEDASMITDIILADDDTLKEYLAEYFTKAMEQNWNNNLSPIVRRNKEMNQYTPQAIQTPPPPQSLKGGVINNEGIFVPHKK